MTFEEAVQKLVWEAHQADGELSAIGHRGTYEKREVLKVSANLRQAIRQVEAHLATQAATSQSGADE